MNVSTKMQNTDELIRSTFIMTPTIKHHNRAPHDFSVNCKLKERSRRERYKKARL